MNRKQESISPSIDEMACDARDHSLMEVRNRAAEQLGPELARMARRVAARYSQFGRDWIEELQSVVWERISQWDNKRPFGGWAYLVMKNHLLDILRQEERHKKAMKACVRESRLEMPEHHSTLAEPFSSEDLRRIEQWHPNRRRLIVLCLFLLWKKIPSAIWEKWVAEAELASPFPSTDFERLTLTERISVLEQRLGITRNLISQDLSRGKAWLVKLSYVRRLCDE